MALTPPLRSPSIADPVSGGAVSVTPSNSVEYSPPLRGLYINVSGTVSLVFYDDTTFEGTLATGVFHPLAGIKKVMATGTTATGIYGFEV